MGVLIYGILSPDRTPRTLQDLKYTVGSFLLIIAYRSEVY